ncbi:MAG TPA: nuclear transport factor 2 family protein [Deltaproteobacteria bacterium]|nr:nuclear transport factor 2 family protein [Deltaproteobacteria bacterium]
MREKYVIAIGIGMMLIYSCSYDVSQKGTYMKNYYEALKKTDPQQTASLKAESDEEKKALNQFRDFYQVFSEEKIRSSVRVLYREDAYFRDGFREVQGIDAIEKYFVSSTEAFLECRFDIQDVSVHDGNYYFRWIMILVLKRNKDDPIEAVGMSHVRFDENGRIIFHQDYWDTGIIYEKVPILGPIITWIRQRV